MRIDVVTIFPGYLAPLREALPGRAIEGGLVELAVHDLRSWTHDVHQAVDDAPYGGGPGMVMRPQVWGEALDAVLAEGPPARLVVPTPAGRPFTQATAQEWATAERLVFACGRYEGIDQRVMEHFAPVEEVSIGDYVLVGGEVAVLVMVEAVVRLLPGVLGNPQSAAQDSFSDGLLEGPAYTRPERWRGLAGAGGAAQRQPRRDRPVAARPRVGAHRRAQARPPRRPPARRARRRRPGVPGGGHRGIAGASGIMDGELAPVGRSRACPARDTERNFAMNTLDALDAQMLRSDIPAFRPGDTLKVHVKVIEGSRSRIQVFQGVVIRRHGAGARETFTVRKMSFGVGVERTFPVHSPNIDRIEVATRGDVRRAKLYYLRDLRGKAAKIKEKRETPSAS